MYQDPNRLATDTGELLLNRCKNQSDMIKVYRLTASRQNIKELGFLDCGRPGFSMLHDELTESESSVLGKRLDEVHNLRSLKQFVGHLEEYGTALERADFMSPESCRVIGELACSLREVLRLQAPKLRVFEASQIQGSYRPGLYGANQGVSIGSDPVEPPAGEGKENRPAQVETAPKPAAKGSNFFSSFFRKPSFLQRKGLTG